MGATLTDAHAQLTVDHPDSSHPLSSEELRKIEAYWRACNYLAAGMIYLWDNPLLREPLTKEHIKNRLLGHWGSSPGLSFTYIHLNRLIKKYDLDAIFLAGPGHGAPGVLGPAYLEGTYSEIYPMKSEDEEGMCAFFKEFSFPGGIGSHCTPETPGSIHEGGELGYRRLTIPTCWSRWSSETANPKPDRWPLPGIRTSSSTRCATARCFRFSI
jgi:xylulose-5-phosphate/fructose-6-phosphate phosphoketolase